MQCPLTYRSLGGLPALEALQSEFGASKVAVVGWDRGENTQGRYECVKPEVFDQAREVWVRLLLRLAEGGWQEPAQSFDMPTAPLVGDLSSAAPLTTAVLSQTSDALHDVTQPQGLLESASDEL